MTFIIDIAILGFIAYFSITKSIKSNPLSEIANLVSMIIAMLGALFLFPELLQNLIFNLCSSLFNINKSQVDINFFNMIAFLIQFFILYIILLSISNYLKNFFNFKGTTLIGKISTIFPSIIRSALIVVIIIYSIESFPNNFNQSSNNLEKSVTYKTLSKVSHIIIK